MPQTSPFLRFHYYEVMDRDHTLIRVELIEDDTITHVFTNLPPEWVNAVKKNIYANQSEDFAFPTSETALEVIRSNPAYRELTDSLASFLTNSQKD